MVPITMEPLTDTCWNCSGYVYPKLFPSHMQNVSVKFIISLDSWSQNLLHCQFNCWGYIVQSTWMHGSQAWFQWQWNRDGYLFGTSLDLALVPMPMEPQTDTFCNVLGSMDPDVVPMPMEPQTDKFCKLPDSRQI